MVNSDQTWRKFDEFLYDQGFLKFAENGQLLDLFMQHHLEVIFGLIHIKKKK